MFKNLIDRLNALSETTEISVPLESDAEGYFDKECPSESCLFGFKVHREDWASIVRDEEVFCPACRHAAPATSWYTQEQIDGAREYALNSIKGAIGEAMR